MGDLKVQLFPAGKEEILIRLANIADLFDSVPRATAMFDLNSYATELYQRANTINANFAIEITERTLGNNKDFDQVERIQWKVRSENMLEMPYEKPSDLPA